MDSIRVEKTPTEVFEALRGDLHKLAKGLMAREGAGHTLRATELLSEVWIGFFAGRDSISEADLEEVYAQACQAMRNILIDHARRRRALKRGGDKRRVPLDVVLDRCARENLDVVLLRDALDELAKVHRRAGAVFTLRFIGGFKIKEVADQLDVSVATVENEYALARGWLRKNLGDAAS
jgi:RNA polymerase sigma-70 factor (ECF subfamily)